MGRKPDTTPEQCDVVRLEWLIDQLEAVGNDRVRASEAGSHSAVASLRREERALRDQIDLGRIQMEAEIAAANAPEMTDAQKSQRLSEMVENASDGELEVAVSEWLKRRRYDLCVDGAGALQLVPQGDQRPDLRLVTG